MDESLPVTLGCICPVSNTKPVGGRRLSHTSVQQQRYRQHSDITNVACVDEQLLAPCGQSFPVFNSFLCGNEWTDNIDVQIVDNTILRNDKVSIFLINNISGDK
jgi:hypothetical protein